MNHNGYALVGCMVSPGFEFRDFELFKRNELIAKYPQHKQIIHKLTTE
ncbi:cupin domain-containing protein [Lacrimispora sp.]